MNYLKFELQLTESFKSHYRYENSVAVVTHNRLSLVQRCYQKIKDQSYLPSEILIIDNDSNDGTQEY